MLRRLNVRTRLIAVIALPLALVVAVVAPGALDHRAEAADARRVVASTRSMHDLGAVLGAVQAERTLAAAVRAGAGAEVAASLDDVRASTDVAVRRAQVAFVEMESLDPLVGTAVAAVREQLTDLPAIRVATDADQSVVAWVDPFAPLTAALLALQEEVGASAADLGTGDGLVQAALLARAKEAAARQDAELAAAAQWEELRGDQAQALVRLRSEQAALARAYLAVVPAELRGEAQEAIDDDTVLTADRLVDQVIEGDELQSLASWLTASGARQEALGVAEAEVIARARRDAERASASSRSASTVGLAVGGATLVAALGLALAVARSINRPLRELCVAADQLAVDRLPLVVDALRHPTESPERSLGPMRPPIEVTARDDLGRLARSFNAVQAVAVEAAAQQAKVLKKGISELYVNLARRNQALIDRQIHLLDELERGEQDAEVLQHLYLLDHLATRMRRNAESLLVLAGSEPGRRRTTPIGILDVVRAALSEIEDYPRVELGTMEPATLHGPAVSDVAHLLAELLENATQLSPPDAPVRVDGAHSDGAYRLSIVDQGVGMRAEQLDDLNAMLREPPVTGLAHGRSLGCLVAARLAARHGIAVRLAAGTPQGIVATVVLPGRLLVEGEALAPASLVGETEPVPELRSMSTAVELGAPTGGPEADLRPARVSLPARLREALPAHAAFEADIKAFFDSETAPPQQPDPGTPADAVLVSVAVEAVEHLHRREPGATMEVLPEPPAEAPQRRSPDEVRGLLTRYRSGLQAGRQAAGSIHEERP